MYSSSSVLNSSDTHPQMKNVTQTSIFLGNKLRCSIFKEHDVYMKLQFKTRELSSNQSVLCARYDLVFSANGQQIWIFNFIIPSDFIKIQQFLEEFAHQFLITDEVLTAASLHHLCHFQNRINQLELDEARDNLKSRFIEDMTSKHIIILDDNDTMISQWDTYMKTEFELDTSIFRYKPNAATIKVNYF